MRYSTVFFLALFFLISSNTGVRAQAPSSHSMEELIILYGQDQGALSRTYTIRNSAQYFNRFEQFYSGWLDKLDGLNFDAFEQSGKVDFLLLKNEVQRSLYFLKANQKRFNNIAPFIPADEPVMEFITQRRRGASMAGQDIAALFNRWNEETLKIKMKLEDEPLFTKKEAAYVADVLQERRRGIKEAYEFYYGYDPDFTWWVEEPFKALDKNLNAFAELARNHFDQESAGEDESGITGTPIGRDEIIRRLGFEMIAYTPEELIKIANEQYAWTLKEMLKASQELGYGNDWKAALEYVKTTYVPAGEQPPLVTKLANEAIDFVEDRDLVTVPVLAKETWRMVMLSPEYQKIAPFFLGGETVRIAYPTNTMSQDEKMMSMRGNNPHFSKAVVHHELIPGHHLQQFMNRRHATHRRMFYTPFWTEGWSLYWEMVLFNKGFPNSPEDKIGMLYWRMHRSARIVFSLNYHLENWSPQECINYLVDKVGHEYANAEAEVRRSFEGNYGPLYQIAYMVGAMQFYSLRMELVDSGKMSEKAYHDAILHNNSIPVAMVKALLTNQKLTKEFKTSWKFGDYIEGM